MERIDYLRVYAHTLLLGGGTFDLDLKPVMLDSGYAVGLLRGNNTVLHDMPNNFCTIAKKIRDVYGSAYIGTWLNDGVIHIDPVVILHNRDVAMRIGRHSGQQAIYDFANQESITL